jgi:hypothetical protein
MKWSPFAAAVLVAAVLAGSGFGQSGDAGLQRQLDEMKARLESHETKLASIKAENKDLKARLGEVAADPIETQINRLQDCNPCSVAVRSGASAITLGGEFRFRRWSTLGDNVLPALGTDGVPGVDQEEHDGHFTDARVRLNFRYDIERRATAFAEVASHWAFGDDPTGPIDDMNGSDTVGDVHMYQAWIELREMFGVKSLSSRLGRQEIVYGNQFQLGNADWYNGVVFDGGRIDYHGKCWDLSLLTLKLSSIDGDINQFPSFKTSHDDDELYGAYFTAKLNRRTTVDAYWLFVNGHGGASGQGSLNSGANAGFGSNPQLGGPGILGFLYPGSEAYWHTLGARIGGTFDLLCGVDYNLEAAYQLGSVHDVVASGADADVDAFAVEAELGVTLSKRSHLRVFARGLYAEGPDEDDVGYLLLYPNRHTYGDFRARYGLADLIPMSNVMTLQAGVHFDPFCNWTFGATGLWAQADEPLVAGDDDYGYELDLWGEWRWSPQLLFGGGVALVEPNDQGVFLWGLADDLQVIGYLETRLTF